MAEEAEPVQMSVKERIAALRLSEVGVVPGQRPSHQQTTPASSNATPRARPPPPPRPSLPARPANHERTQSSNVLTSLDHGSVANREVGNTPIGPSANGMDGISRPALPPRTSTQSSLNPPLPPRRPSEKSPSLPPRRPSETPSQPDYQLSRRGSNESISSVATGRSSISGISATTGTSVGSYKIRAPAYDPSSLPALPPKQTQEQKDAYYGAKKTRRPLLKSNSSSPNLTKQDGTTPPPGPRRISGQPNPVNRVATVQEEPLQIEPAPSKSSPVPPQPSRTPIPPPRPTRNIEPPPPRKSALDWGLNKSTSQAPSINMPRPGSIPATTNGQTNGAPPPIPTGSRPDLASLQASKPNMNGAATGGQQSSAGTGSCLHCRDFSGPDNHAARFPRQSIPSTDVGWLATQLTSPFPSATDKARAIFTWLHHNVAYDWANFKGNSIQKSTPQGTIQSGLAVCEGYAGLFAALALKAGLEAHVVSGASKGYGYNPNEPMPPYKSTHAWNAVKIDDGMWKLIDACWGAGHVSDEVGYTKAFNPVRFTQSNDEFGRDHFPGDNSKQYRNDGRVLTYEEYFFLDKKAKGGADVAGNVRDEGLLAESFKPSSTNIVLSEQVGPTVRFSFQRICPHWDPIRNGKGKDFLYVLRPEALEKSREALPRVFQTNGSIFWCDVPARELGAPGQKVWLWAFKEFNGHDARGLTVKEYQDHMNRTGYSYQPMCTWTVA